MFWEAAFTTAAHKSYSQPARWRADAIINILSLLLWSPPMCVHSSPKNVSAVPIRPRHRPIRRSPLTAWMYADNRQTHIQSVTGVFYRHNQRKSVIISQCTHFWPSTAPRSPHSSPEQWSPHSSPSTDQTSTKLSPLQRSPLDPPAGPPSSKKIQNMNNTV